MSGTATTPVSSLFTDAASEGAAQIVTPDRRCKCGHRESEHRVGKTPDFGGYCCAYVGVGGAGFRSWCQCPGFEAYKP